jgi:hypothetical protein
VHGVWSVGRRGLTSGGQSSTGGSANEGDTTKAMVYEGGPEANTG